MLIKSFAKINLSLDVGNVMSNGMHPVDMLMQTISLCDEVRVEVLDALDGTDAGEAEDRELGLIRLTCNNPQLPTDRGNLAYRAAELMLEKAKEIKSCDKGDSLGSTPKIISIHIEKRIPVAAGLAGGSGNCAAVILGLNSLLDLNLKLEELCEIGSKLGSDVPFCILGQGATNQELPEYIQRDKLVTTAARATGTGTMLAPCEGIRTFVLLAKPEIGVSTGEVYRGIDSCNVPERPDNDALQKAIKALRDLEKNGLDDNSLHNAETREKNWEIIKNNMINVLENYTLAAYPGVGKLKEKMEELFLMPRDSETSAIKVLMSGSGPTVYALFDNEEGMMAAKESLQKNMPAEYEIHTCRTL